MLTAPDNSLRNPKEGAPGTLPLSMKPGSASHHSRTQGRGPPGTETRRHHRQDTARALFLKSSGSGAGGTKARPEAAPFADAGAQGRARAILLLRSSGCSPMRSPDRPRRTCRPGPRMIEPHHATRASSCACPGSLTRYPCCAKPRCGSDMDTSCSVVSRFCALPPLAIRACRPRVSSRFTQLGRAQHMDPPRPVRPEPQAANISCGFRMLADVSTPRRALMSPCTEAHIGVL